MLRAIQHRRGAKSGGEFAIVAAKYNRRYVDAMVEAARLVLKQAGARVRVVRVPGAYEIPMVAAKLAREDRGLGAIICLGVILRGETAHAQLIGEAVTAALMQIQVEHGVPVIHEVLLLENRQQAETRCLSPKHNRGTEAASTAVEMAQVMNKLSGVKAGKAQRS